MIDTRAQMALMDRLIVNDGEAKVIDIGFHAFDDFFRMITEIGFFKEAARQGIRPLVIYAPDTDRVSTRGYEDICRKVPYDSLMVLDNEFVLRGPLPEIYSHGYSLYIRALPMFLKTYIDRHGLLVHQLPAAGAVIHRRNCTNGSAPTSTASVISKRS